VIAFLAAVPAVVFVLACIVVVAGVTAAVICWCTRPDRPVPGEDEALAVAASAGPPPRPVLSEKHLEVLGQLATRRRFAKAIDIANAQMLADSCRVACPHLTDTELGVLMLDLHGYMVAAQRGAGDGAWAMARMTAAMGIAAVELTELERMGSVQ
jgi:hypothetical protein